MASAVATQPSDTKTLSYQLQGGPQISSFKGRSSVPSKIEVDAADIPRGRVNDARSEDDEGSPECNPASDDTQQIKKRRRSRKGHESKFTCNATGCGRKYSRQEHLYE
jgi:hypothetical protein